MRTTILRIAVVLAILIAAVLLFAATKPNTIHIQRSIRISAPPEKIFPLINDLHRWKDWDPQDREDATVTQTYSGPASGVGALSDWDSRGSAGKGRMTVLESLPLSKITIQVDFAKPFQTRNLNEFTLDPAGNATRVTWSWDGKNLYFMKVMGVFMNMDKMIGKHFETGLDNLKSVSEK